MRIALVFASLVIAAACGKSRCEKYAEMEVRCGGYPKAEEDLVRTMSEGMCETTDTVEKELAAPVEHAADCAAKFLKKDSADCHGYKQCKEAGPQ
jgi:hypothetical protein